MRYLLLSAALAALAALAATAIAQRHDHGAASVPAANPAPDVPPQASAQIAVVREAVRRYEDFEVARREGWTRFGGDSPLMGEHYSLKLKKGGVDYVGAMPLDTGARPI